MAITVLDPGTPGKRKEGGRMKWISWWGGGVTTPAAQGPSHSRELTRHSYHSLRTLPAWHTRCHPEYGGWEGLGERERYNDLVHWGQGNSVCRVQGSWFSWGLNNINNYISWFWVTLIYLSAGYLNYHVGWFCTILTRFDSSWMNLTVMLAVINNLNHHIDQLWTTLKSVLASAIWLQLSFYVVMNDLSCNGSWPDIMSTTMLAGWEATQLKG